MYRWILALALVITGCRAARTTTDPRSLTDQKFTGKKQFFAWSEALPGKLGNEVRFDTAHLSRVFSADEGGAYSGKVLLNRADVTADKLRLALNDMAQNLNSDDMYLQYSAGHGFRDRLAVGLTYDELRNSILRLKAREIVVFVMSCYAGRLVQSFENDRAFWEKTFKADGRTLYIMASSGPDEKSAAGPGTDTDEPIDLAGAAGSRFGLALWKAFRGAADGFGTSGVEDGAVTLGEITDYVQTTVAAQEKNRHRPIITGIWDPGLVMATPSRTPSADERWVKARAQLKPRIEALMAAISAHEAELKNLPARIASLHSELTLATPPTLIPWLDGLAQVQAELQQLIARRAAAASDAAVRYEALISDDDGIEADAADLATYVEGDRALTTFDDDRLNELLNKVVERLDQLQKDLERAAVELAEPEKSAERRKLIARQKELVDTLRKEKNELTTLNAELQKVVDGLLLYTRT